MTSYNILFLCTGNSARSILGEALATQLSGGRFKGYSAGSNPQGRVHPLAQEICAKIGYSTKSLRSKSWNEFVGSQSPKMDLVITVCDSAASEVCPVLPGHPCSSHWGFPDPAAVKGTLEERRQAFNDVFIGLKKCVNTLLSLPVEELSREELRGSLTTIGENI